MKLSALCHGQRYFRFRLCFLREQCFHQSFRFKMLPVRYDNLILIRVKFQGKRQPIPLLNVRIIRLWYRFSILPHFHKRFIAFRIGFTKCLRIKTTSILIKALFIVHLHIENAFWLLLSCFTHTCKVFLHLREIAFQSSCLLQRNRIDVNFNISYIHSVIIIKSVKQIVLPLIRGKLHYHVKVWTVPFKSPASAPWYGNIHDCRSNGIIINLCLHMAFHGILNLRRVHKKFSSCWTYAYFMKKFVCLFLKIFHDIPLQNIRHDTVHFLNFFH